MTTLTAEKPETDDAPPNKGKRGLLIALGATVLLIGGGAAAYLFVPGIADKAHDMMAQKEAPPPGPPPGPVFADLPEMSVTLPNGGQPRQLRIRISLELMQTTPALPPTEVLSPKVYDGLLTYLRTLSDSEVANSLAIDRIRGDVYRRLTLILGPNVVRDVLITNLVVG